MRALWLPILLLVASGPLFAAGEEFQFPPPEFSQGYHYPQVSKPGPRAAWLGYVDVGVLALTLGLAAYLALRRRRRRDLVVLAIFSLLYFGLYRHGCICSVGALQNVAAAAAGVGLGLPAVAAAFFLLPLLFALVFGRVFCSAVCPLGAAQEVVLLRPVRVPPWLDTTLGTLPYIYLGAAVLFAATGSAFIVCDYDPFIIFFRLAGSVPMLIFGICILLLATVIGRPYCRYLCPYGVLLRLLAPFARWQVRITPHQCVNCHLCAEACPYGAIRAPTPEPGTLTRRTGRGQLAALLLLLPVLIAAGGWLVSLSRPILARVHPQVRLANRLWLEEQGRLEGKTPLTEAFELQGLSSSDAYRDAAAIHRRFGVGGWLFGGWLGLVLGLKMIGQSIRRHRPEYEVDAGGCVACGRCYAACPIEHAGAPALAALNVDGSS